MANCTSALSLFRAFSLQPLTKRAPQGHIIVRFLLDKRARPPVPFPCQHTHTPHFSQPLNSTDVGHSRFCSGCIWPPSTLVVVALNGFPRALIGVKSTGRLLDHRGTKGQGLREPEGPLTRGTAVTV